MNATAGQSCDNYIDQLTWLRGLAAFFVIITHTTRATEVESSDNIIMSVLSMGSFGVVLFFVLSGCTLYISNSRRVGSNEILHFYIKRFFRIWPAFVVSLCIYASFSYFFSIYYGEPKELWIEKQFLESFSLGDFFSYITLTFNITGPEGLFNIAYWSLPVEFQYYLVFPLIIFLLQHTGIMGPIMFAIIMYFFPKFGITHFDNNIVFTLTFSFCGGVLLGYFYEKSTFRFNVPLALILLCTFTAMASLITMNLITLPDFPPLSNRWNWFGGIAVLTVGVVLFTEFNLNERIASFLKYYGTISYSTYLYHNIFIAMAALFIINFEIYDSGARLWLTFFFTLFATFLAAWASYKYIESPAIVLGRKLVIKNI